MDFGHTLLQILSAQGMWAGVLATLTFVAIGFFVTRSGLFSKEINGKISKFVLTYALPFLCIIAFMQNANADKGKEVGIVIALSVVFYLVMALISWAVIKYWPHLVSKSINKKAEELYAKSDKSLVEDKFKEAYLNSYRQKVLTTQMMVSYGSLQFFAYPLVIAMQGSVFGPYTLALAQTWCIPYMIGAFSYVRLQYSGQKVTRKDLKPVIKSVFSPMMICLYFSLIMWLLQFIPGLNGNYAIVEGKPYTPVNVNFAKAEGLAYGQFWGGFLKNLPAIGNILVAGVKIVSPLAWIVIGGTLATSNLKEAIKDKSVWFVTILKLVIMPLIIFLIVLLFAYPFSGKGSAILAPDTATLIVLFAATPPAAVCIIFSVAANHEHSGFTAEVSSLSTLLCLVAMPFWVVIANAAFNVLAHAA